MTVGRSQSVAERASLDFEGFFRSEYGQLFKTMYLVVGDAAEAEGIAQEAMARAYERWDRVAQADSPSAYLYRIAFNLQRSRLRRIAVALRKRHLLASSASIPDPTGIRAEALAALRSVPATQRAALVLVEWFGFTSEEAGRLLGIEPASVRGRVHRAKESLRRRFGDDDA
jgi:RNA polymerase sigma factor (sigma-70 family)